MNTNQNPVFTFVTTNQEKISEAELHLKPFNLSFSTKKLDLIEIQSDSSEDIAHNKAEQAFNLIQSPVVVTDHHWSIPALNGFPGPYMKYINHWFTTRDIQKLMRTHEDKTIIKSEILCYWDKQGSKIITSSMVGQFVDQARGRGLPVMQVVSLLPDGKTVAKCIENNAPTSLNYDLWEKFATWFQRRRTDLVK